MHWELKLAAADDGNEVLLEDVDDSFGGVVAVVIWRVYGGVIIERIYLLFEVLVCFIVKILYLGCSPWLIRVCLVNLQVVR